MKRFTSVLLSVLIVLSLFTACFVSADAKTTTDHRYKDEYNSTFEKYPDFQNLAKENFPIPGLETTDVIDSNACVECHDMVPQGICVTKKYILITAYCKPKEHKSVIYVLDKSTKELLITLTLEEKNHVGGIAYDGNYIWIAKSTKRVLSALLESDIDELINKGNKSDMIQYYAESVSCKTCDDDFADCNDCIASFVTAYNGSIWVGVHNGSGNSLLKEFKLSGNNEGDFKLNYKRTLTIPSGANGASFAMFNGKSALAVNCSYGRKTSSKTYVYTADFAKSDSEVLELKYTYTLPPMSEEICVDGSTVYTIFESSATEYSTHEDDKCEDIVDSACIGNLSDWFLWFLDDSNNASESDFLYKVLSDGTAEITKYRGKQRKLIIPSTIDGYKVSIIGDRVFSKSDVVSVIIPYGITAIGNCVFEECKDLVYVSIPNSVTTLYGGVFSSCTKLSNINIPDSVTYIEDNVLWGTAFENDESNWDNGVLYAGKHLLVAYNDIVPEEYIVKSGTLTIASKAFSYCFDLKNVVIPGSVKSIGEQAFYECHKLEKLTIPDSVKKIGSNIVHDTKISETKANWQNGLLYVGNHLVDAKNSELDEEVIIRDGTVSVSDRLFFDNRNIISVRIPETVKRIEERTFNCCSSLKNVNIPLETIYIGNEAFCGCASLENINIPNKVIEIGSEAFIGCESIRKIIIPDSVEKIGEGAFKNCASAMELSISSSIKNLPEYVFFGCKSLKSVTIPENINIIGRSAFENCESINDLVLNNGLINIDTTAFEYCSGIESITFPESVRRIGYEAFSSCLNLKTINIPDSVDTLYDNSFECTEYYNTKENWEHISTYNVPSLYIGNHFVASNIDARNCNNYTIKDGTKTIGSNALGNFNSISTITIPFGVRIINAGAFANCFELTDVYFLGTENEWNEIQICEDNDYLLNANIHFGSPSDSNATNPAPTEPEGTNPAPTEPEGTNPVPTEPDVTEPGNYDGELIPGDVNYDGKVNMKDVTRLQKYINKWEVEIKEENCDVNGDDKITMKDIILLQKYINKWDVVLK